MFKTVEEVRYTNNEKDTLSVLFTDDDDTLQQMYIPVDGPERKELESMGITEEIIIASTGEYKRVQKRAIDNIIKNTYKDELESAEKKAKREHEKIDKFYKMSLGEKKREIANYFFDALLEDNDNKEFLFKAKIDLLEKDAIKKQNKTFKSKIRKADTMSKLIEVIIPIL